MLIKQTVNIVVNSNHLNHYINLGYSAICRQPLDVNPAHLPPGSHTKVIVICDHCNELEEREFRGIKFFIDKTYCNNCRPLYSKRKVRNYTDEEKQAMIKKIKETHKKLKDSIPDYIKEIQIKTRTTKLLKYSAETFNNQLKKSETLQAKYGDSHYNNSLKRKSTLKKVYGNDCYNNQEKKENTCLQKYGVRHTNHVPEIFDRIQKSAFVCKQFEDSNLFYRGSYEYDFLLYCKENNVFETIQKAHTIPYIFEGKTRKYYPDFYHAKSNTIIEIKSTYTYNKNKEVNNAKEKACKEAGYNYLLVIDKNYDGLNAVLHY